MAGLDEIPVTMLSGVGPAVALKLQKLHLHTVLDVLFHLPHRYEDRTRLWPIGQVRAYESVQIQGEIRASRISLGKKRSLEVEVEDASGLICLRFFYFSAAQKNQLSPGRSVRCFGEVRPGKTGLEIYHPEYQVLTNDRWPPLNEHLTPVYPLTEGLSQTRIRQIVRQALHYLQSHCLTDFLPETILTKYRFPEMTEALKIVHEPPVGEAVTLLTQRQHPSQTRFVYEELMAHHYSLLALRKQIKVQRAFSVPHPDRVPGTLIARFLANLPYQLTRAQQRVVREIHEDMAQTHPMLRLVQGDVGSGKTVVAALAALAVVDAGKQVALMAPTEILAEQHRLNFENWFSELGVSIGWLSGKTKGKKRDKVLEQLADGEVQVAIGTHALFQEDVRFKKLALVIVDEQHRFGVHQRMALKEKSPDGTTPHQLIMTATPIPRTLAMAAYADLDTSVIDELPPGRKEVHTAVVPDTKRMDVIQRVEKACQSGKQAYWVCTLIEESEVLQCQAAETTFSELQSLLPTLKVGIIHGRLSASDKAEVMQQFKDGKLDLLVATTVIEVGVDVPNASLIIIENPERLGLAQLHQLRGRVGRGDQESYCLLLYSSPLSENGKARLMAMREYTSGFDIAEKDLEIRGPGELLGTRQTGLMDFRMADLERDGGWLQSVRDDAPLLEDNTTAIQGLIGRWIGSRIIYGEV